jgi:integrase
MPAKDLLTALEVEKAKPGLKPRKAFGKNGDPSKAETSPIAVHKDYSLSDGAGLHLVVTPAGGKWWHFRYRFSGTPRKISLGVFPDVTLAEARDLRDEARRNVAQGIDPSSKRQTDKVSTAKQHQQTFEAITKEWFGENYSKGSAAHAKRVNARFTNDLFPALGARPIVTITRDEIRAAIKEIETRGCLEQARRTLNSCCEVFRYAKSHGYTQEDVSVDLILDVDTPSKSHFAAITKGEQAGPLLRAIWGYEGTAVVQSALRLAPLLFCRPGELRTMEWSALDLQKREWLLPLEKDQSREKLRSRGEVVDSHLLVPLAPQACRILERLIPLTGNGRYVFPSIRTSARPMSDGTVNAALRATGYTQEQHTGHGFRAMARTMLADELKIQENLIEHELGHVVRFPNGRAYDRASYIQERDLMMRVWADYLDDLRAGKPPKGLRTTPLEDVRAIMRSEHY